MSDLDGLIKLIPVGDLAKKIGVDPAIAEAAVAIAVPAIVAGLAANTKNAAGAASLEKALDKHTATSTKISEIDEADGSKIVGHVFGDKKDAVVAAAATAAPAKGIDFGPIVAQVLPIIAPIVLSYLATQLSKGAAAPAAAEAKPAATSGGIGDILGSLVSSPQAQSAIGGLLGGLLGGK